MATIHPPRPPFWRRHSTWAAIAALLLAGVALLPAGLLILHHHETTYRMVGDKLVPESVGNKQLIEQSALVVAVFSAFVASFVAAFFLQGELVANAEDLVVQQAKASLEDTRLRNEIASLSELLRLQAADVATPWLGNTMRQISGVLSQCKGSHQHCKAHVEKEIERSIEVITASIYSDLGAQVDVYAKEDERRRQLRLRRAIQDANDEVLAVTLDLNGYFGAFWEVSAEPTQSYLSEHYAASGRTVKICRIFAMQDGAITGDNVGDRERLRQLLREHANFASGKGWVRVVRIGDIPGHVFGRRPTSFLIADEHFISESYCLEPTALQSNEGYSIGHSSVAKDPRLASLKARWAELVRLRDYSDAVRKGARVRF